MKKMEKAQNRRLFGCIVSAIPGAKWKSRLKMRDLEKGGELSARQDLRQAPRCIGRCRNIALPISAMLLPLRDCIPLASCLVNRWVNRWIPALQRCWRSCYGWQAACSYYHSRRCQPLPPPRAFCNYRGKRGFSQCQDDCYNTCVQQLNPNDPIYNDEVNACYDDCSSCCNNYKNSVPLL